MSLLTIYKITLENIKYKIILTVSNPVSTDSVTSFDINLGTRLNAKLEIYLLPIAITWVETAKHK